ncbi:MAG: hypothetical protein J7J92_01415 [Candidatus Aenigmarchaeota archaeon]|nr:hypothetical protein [Candidatus Aenigmarchaeota archaeon]
MRRIHYVAVASVAITFGLIGFVLGEGIENMFSDNSLGYTIKEPFGGYLKHIVGSVFGAGSGGYYWSRLSHKKY